MKHLLPILTACLVGCANNVGKSVVVKTTVLGIDASTGMPNTPGLRLGLVRNFYATVPSGATLSSDVDATVTPTRDTVREKLAFGVPPSPMRFAHTNAPATNEASLTNTVTVRRPKP